jgi:hypothetical protein
MTELKEVKKQIALKPYTLKELSAIYGMNWRTFKKWLVPFQDEIGEKRGRYYQIPQVRTIFKKLDLPCMLDVD